MSLLEVSFWQRITACDEKSHEFVFLLQRAFKATSCSDRDAARGIAEELYNTKTNVSVLT